MSTNPNAIGRRWAYAGLGFGAVGSVVANVAHALLPPTACLPGVGSSPDHLCLSRAAVEAWEPSLVAIGWGITVAVALVIITQVLERIDWPDETAARIARFGGGGVVALVAAATSYYHLSDLLLHAGREWAPLAYTGPALVDGMMMVCSFALIYTGAVSAPVAVPEVQSGSVAHSDPEALRTPAAYSADPEPVPASVPPEPSAPPAGVPAPALHSVPEYTPAPGEVRTPPPVLGLPSPGGERTPVPVSALRRTNPARATTTAEVPSATELTPNMTDDQIISHMIKQDALPSIRTAKKTYKINQDRAQRLIREAGEHQSEGKQNDHQLETKEESARKPVKESHLGTTSDVGEPSDARSVFEHDLAHAGDIP